MQIKKTHYTQVHMGVCAECGTDDLYQSLKVTAQKRYPDEETPETGKLFKAICNNCYSRLANENNL